MTRSVPHHVLDRARALGVSAGADFLSTGLWRPCPFRGRSVHEFARAWADGALDAIAPVFKQKGHADA